MRTLLIIAQFLFQCKIFVETLLSSIRAAVQEIVQLKILSLLYLLYIFDIVLLKSKPTLKQKLTCNNVQQSADIRSAKRY